MENKKIIVVGGGAAGFFCAIQIAELHPDWDISILEKSNKLLSKVRVSGGGRCNVTHACPDVELLLKKYPRGARFLKKAFYEFATKNTIQWFANNGVQLHTEKDGRMFPTTNNSATIIDCFLQKVHQYKIKILTDHEVVNVEKIKKENQNDFLITLSNNKTMQADAICLATGNKTIEKGPLLITHWGISGPAAIKLSAWCARELANDNYEGAIVINWTPEYNEATLKMEWINLRMDFGKREMGSKNPFNLPQRLWQFLLQEAGIVLTTKWADLKSPQQQQLIQSLTRTTLTIKGKTTFKEEFVTCGGVELSEIEASTMESKLVPGLYFAGEMMDVDGITGGFNFQHAWTSGWTAAQAMGRMG